MRNWIVVLAFFWAGALFGQDQTHHVAKGETLYSISRFYGVTVEELIEANPILAEGLKEGQDLSIPPSTQGQNPSRRPTSEPRDTNRYDYYRVKPKETLYSLSRSWDVSISDLVDLNPSLENGLKVNQVLKLPKGTLEPGTSNIAEDTRPGWMRYRVQAGETVYSLTKAFDITTEELFAQNPTIRELGLRSESQIWVPDTSEVVEVQALVADSSSNESLLSDGEISSPADSALAHEQSGDSKRTPKRELRLVRVQPEDSWSVFERKYNTRREDVIRLNPEMVGGLEVGKNVIVPVHSASRSENSSSDSTSQSMAVPVVTESDWARVNGKKLHVALALPLFLEENDSLAAESRVSGQSKMFNRSQIAWDFYAGFRLAIDTLRTYGLEVEVDIYDTRNDPLVVRQIAQSIRGNRPDVVIGPLYSRNVEAMAAELPDVWIVSPLSRTTQTSNTPRLIQATTPLNEEHMALARWVNENARDANVILVRRNLESERLKVQSFLEHIEASSYRTISHMKVGEELISTRQVRSATAAGKKDVFVVLDDDPVLLTSFINGVSSVSDSSITVLATSRLLAVKTLEPHRLNRLDLYISDVEHIDYNNPLTSAFLQSFRNRMGGEPPRFAYHGFDSGLYFSGLFAVMNGNPLVWPQIEGVIKNSQLLDFAGKGPVNTGVYLLHLEDYTWVRTR